MPDLAWHDIQKSLVRLAFAPELEPAWPTEAFSSFSCHPEARPGVFLY